MIEVSCRDGKYTFRCDDKGTVTCDRYGEPWFEFEKGGNALLALLQEFSRLREKYESLTKGGDG